MNETARPLRQQWRTLWQSLSTNEELIHSLFADVAAHYSEDGRYYHTLDHVDYVLATAQRLRDEARDFTAVQLALWFHDVIYDPRAADNEEKSAAYAEQALRRLQLAPETIAHVSQLILATKTHQTAVNDVDTHIVLDADLAILGAERQAYARYARDIRREFDFVSEPAYRQGRRRILAQFLRRDRIYRTGLLFATRETRARQNITWEMAVLSSI